jgi:hypothetical protein
MKKSEREISIEWSEKNGVYSLESDGNSGHYVELSALESSSQTFDAERLSKALGIAIEDALLLSSRGKTYVFAKTEDGRTLLLYHPSFFCNDLSIHVEFVGDDRIKQFNHSEWLSAKYARRVGMTDAPNHFVC